MRNGTKMAAKQVRLIVELDPDIPDDVLEHIKQLLQNCRPYVRDIVKQTELGPMKIEIRKVKNNEL